MFAHANGANGALRAQIVFYGLLGNVTGILNVTDFDPSGYASWAPSRARAVAALAAARDGVRAAAC